MVHALLAFAVVCIAMTFSARPASAGAPREGRRFVNPAGPGDRGDVTDMFPFLVRKIGATIAGREGGAAIVPFDRSAVEKNPSITWIGHATFFVRMDGITFLTDPIFSDRASRSPSPAEPPRAPGIPLEALPRSRRSTSS
jgi:hypothetical protein